MLARRRTAHKRIRQGNIINDKNAECDHLRVDIVVRLFLFLLFPSPPDGDYRGMRAWDAPRYQRNMSVRRRSKLGVKALLSHETTSLFCGEC